MGVDFKVVRGVGYCVPEAQLLAAMGKTRDELQTKKTSVILVFQGGYLAGGTALHPLVDPVVLVTLAMETLCDLRVPCPSNDIEEGLYTQTDCEDQYVCVRGGARVEFAICAQDYGLLAREHEDPELVAAKKTLDVAIKRDFRVDPEAVFADTQFGKWIVSKYW